MTTFKPTLNTVDLRERIALCADFSPAERDLILDAINLMVPPDTAAVSSPNYLGRIDHVWMALSVDAGGEGVCAAPVPGTMLTAALVAADKRRLDSFVRPSARRIAEMFGQPVRIAKFSTREDVEIFRP